MSHKSLFIGAIILTSLGVLRFALSAEAEDNIRDLSTLLRVDLRAASAIVKEGEDIGLVATLTNLTQDSVAVVPPRLFGYVNFQFEPRCGGDVGGTGGQSIREGGIGLATENAVVLKPKKSISRNGTLKQPAPPKCERGGSWVITVDYCQFETGKFRQLDLLEGCVSSNPVVVELRP